MFMDITEIQTVLDRVVALFGSTLSPQILRSAVEYGEIEAGNPDLGETDDKMSALAQRVLGFIAGYCDCVDDKGVMEVDDIYISDKIARDIIELIRTDYGEEYGYTAFIGAARYADLTAAGLPDDSDANNGRIVIRNCILGYLDGFSQAECDIENNKFIRNMALAIPDGIYADMYDMVADEINMAEDFRNDVKADALAGLDRVLKHYLYTKSGRVADDMVAPETLMTLYILGFVKGANTVHDVEINMPTYAKIIKDVTPAERIILKEIVLWAERWGRTRKTGERAAAATFVFTRKSVSAASGEDDYMMTDMDAVLGMGYVDGLEHLLGKRVMKRGHGDMQALADEVNDIFKDMEGE